MINPTALDIATLPSLPLESRIDFPEATCIYFAIDPQGEIQYIGQTKNLKQRWYGHQLYPKLSSSNGVRIAYLPVDADLLISVEAALIQWFDPPLNRVALPAKEGQGRQTSIKNKIKPFLSSRGITRYRFTKETGISPTTAYGLYENPDQYPAKHVMDAICRVYGVDPNEVLEYSPD